MSLKIPFYSFLKKHFAPENRLAEIICGLVMVLSFTGATTIAFQHTTSRQLVIAILGCNIAWGIVDGVTYILGNLMTRGARTRLIQTLKRSPQDPIASTYLAKRLDASFGNVLTPDQLHQLQQWVIQGSAHSDPEPTRLIKEDLYTGLACFLIVFSAALPVLVPFLFIQHLTLALRASNALALALLFFIGWHWGGNANIGRFRTGLALLTLGLVLVMITVALGG